MECKVLSQLNHIVSSVFSETTQRIHYQLPQIKQNESNKSGSASDEKERELHTRRFASTCFLFLSDREKREEKRRRFASTCSFSSVTERKEKSSDERSMAEERPMSDERLVQGFVRGIPQKQDIYLSTPPFAKIFLIYLL